MEEVARSLALYALAARGRAPRPSSPPSPSLRLIVLCSSSTSFACRVIARAQYSTLPPWHHQQTSSWRWHALLPCTAGAGSRRPPQAFVVVQHPYTVCALFHHCNPLLLFAQGKVLFLVTLPWPRILLWEKINHHLFCDKTSSAHEQDVGVIKDLPVCSSQQPPIQVLQYSRFPCVWPIPQLQFNYGEPEWSLKHVVLMSVLHFTFTIH